MALAASGLSLAVLRSLRSGDVSRWFYPFLACLTLIRLDAGILTVGTLIFLSVVQPAKRRGHLIEGFGWFLVVLLGQTVCRWVYYGDIVPNTYYLKMTGFPPFQRIGYGFLVLWQRILQLNWALCLFPFVAAFLARRKDILFLVWLILCEVAYSVYVGGDAWEWIGTNRYLAVVVPLFFVLFSFSLVTALDRAARWLHQPAPATWAVFPVVLLALVRFNYVGEMYSLLPVLLKSAPPSVSLNEQMVRRAKLLSEISLPEAKLAVVWGGAIPYFTKRPCVDLLGKSDRRIARQPMKPVGLLPFYPGHMKRDYGYSIGELKPDVVVQLWVYPQEAKRWLEADYVAAQVSDYRFWVRKRSPNVLWSKLTIPPPKL